jgi:hypothetical protein
MTVSGGLGDSAYLVHSLHRPMPQQLGTTAPSFDHEGTCWRAFYDGNYFSLGSIRGLVTQVELQLEQRRKLGRRDALAEALRYTPLDRTPLRVFNSEQGGEVHVFHSAELARRLPDPTWYLCHQVGTFEVMLQQIPGDRDYYAITIGPGVDYDEGDPKRKDC